MKFSVIHPTARMSGPLAWWKSQKHWYETSDRADIEYIVVVHASRLGDFWAPSGIAMGSWGRFTVVVNHGRDCLVDQCNEGMKAATGEILIWNQDDLFAPQGWDAKLSALCPDTSQPISLHCLTGSPRDNQLYMPICYTKALADLIGPASPEYDGMFADDEACEKIRRLGTVIETGLRFEHRHPTNGKSEFDEVYERENRNAAYFTGLEVLKKRAALGFPYVELPGFKKPANLPAKPARLIALNLPGETFRFEWLKGLFELVARLWSMGFDVPLNFGYTTSPYHTRINLTNDVLNAAKAGIRPEYVLWIDDDNLLKPQDAARLISFLDSHPEADAVSGWCWIRQKERWGISCGMFSDDTQVHMRLFELPELMETGAPRVMEVGGFPCILMRYEVLERLGPGAFQPVTKADLRQLLGDLPRTSEVIDAWFSGEDISFFLHARKAGLKIFVDPSCKVAHLKFVSQEPDIQLYRDTPEELKQWRQQVNGKAIPAPSNYEEVLPVS